MEKYEGLVRPAVMVLLVLAQVALAWAWAMGWENAKDAFSALGTFTMAVVVYLFKSRDLEKADALPAGTTTTTTTKTPAA